MLSGVPPVPLVFLSILKALDERVYDIRIKRLDEVNVVTRTNVILQSIPGVGSLADAKVPVTVTRSYSDLPEVAKIIG